MKHRTVDKRTSGPRSKTGKGQRGVGKAAEKAREEDALEPARSESDVTKEDLEALGDSNLSMDMNEDEQLKHRGMPVDFSGRDLDVPGAEQDDDREDVGSEDEENNPYSLGGDRQENLEEDKT